MFSIERSGGKKSFPRQQRTQVAQGVHGAGVAAQGGGVGQAFDVPADLLAHFLHGDALAFVVDGEGGVVEHDLSALGKGGFR